MECLALRDSISEETTMTDLEQLRYPVGRFERLTAPLDRAARAALIDIDRVGAGAISIAASATHRRAARHAVSSGGWTIRQVVHHVPDSHMNAYIRMKFAVDRRRSRDQGVRRSAMGGAAGSEDRSGRHVARAARRAASALGDVPPRAAGRGFRESVRASGAGTRDARRGDRAVRMALPPSRRAIKQGLGLRA